jgi:hypothetical protein
MILSCRRRVVRVFYAGRRRRKSILRLRCCPTPRVTCLQLMQNMGGAHAEDILLNGMFAVSRLHIHIYVSELMRGFIKKTQPHRVEIIEHASLLPLLI